MGVAANGVAHVDGWFTIERDGGTQQLRLVALDGVALAGLERESELERIRFEDLSSLSENSKTLTILFVDLDVLDAGKRAELIAGIGRANRVRAITIEDEKGASNCEGLVRAGFAGVLRRDCSRETFLRALQSVADGQLWFPREIISRVLKGFLIEEELNRLTSREIEILQLVGTGAKNQQIADRLFISRETVRWHVRSLNAKLGLKDRRSAREYVRYLHSGNPKMPSASVPPVRQSVAS